MRRKARVDANHSAVTEALRAAGYVVVDCSRMGGGFPDLLACKHGVTHWIEVKDGSKSASRRKLTEDEATFHQALFAAGVRVKIITSIEEAVRL